MTARSIGKTELIRRLSWTSVRRQTANLGLGGLWWLIDPLVMITVYAVVFGGVLGIGRSAAEGSYPLFLACALIPWRWFAQATTKGASALAQHAAVITAFPIRRESIVLSEITSASFLASIGFPVLAIFAFVYDRSITENLLYLPVPLVVMAILIASIALALAPLAVIAPDTIHLWAVVLRVMWFVSPGLYRWEQVPEAYRHIYAVCNPMVGILEGIRRPIHDGLPPAWEPLAYSMIWAVLLLLTSIWMFRRLEEPSIRFL